MVLWLAIVLNAPFTCTSDSGAIGGDSTREDCADGECGEYDEICYDDSLCDTGEDNCPHYDYDLQCHKDCTIDEECGAGEDCTYAGSDTWLCI